MSKHTPGPWTKADRLNGPWWHISSDHTVGGQPCKSGRQAVACVHGESKRGAKAYAEMFEANARLIAAAPELLDALRDLLDVMTGQKEGEAMAIQNAVVAINKATGAV